VFRSYYRCNTGRALARVLGEVGLGIEELLFIHSGVVFAHVPAMWAFELAIMRLTSMPLATRLRAQILLNATKRG
jgi:hypothetical protein